MFILYDLKLTFANIKTKFINRKLNAVTIKDKKAETSFQCIRFPNYYFFANSSNVLPSKRQIAFL